LKMIRLGKVLVSLRRDPDQMEMGFSFRSVVI